MKRTHGSGEDFDREWAEVLSAPQHRRLQFYPSATTDNQVALLEWVKAQQILSLLRTHGIRTGRVLEYGCGSAGMSIFLKERGYQAYALDVSRYAIKVAQTNDVRHRTVAEPLRVLVGDALAFPFADASFDVVISYGLLEHFDEATLRDHLAQATRLLKPGGLFLADIIPERLNIRVLDTWLNYGGASLYYLLRRDTAALRTLPQRLFDQYYESSFGPEVYDRLLREQGLRDVRVQVCRPFPTLAGRGPAEKLYVRGMRALMPFWRRFDGSKSAVNRRLGWMYLASGVRPAIA